MGTSLLMLTPTSNQQPVVTALRSDQGRQLVWKVRPTWYVKVLPRQKTKNRFHRADFRAP